MENGNKKLPLRFGLKPNNPNSTEGIPTSVEHEEERESISSSSPFFQGLLWGTIFTLTAIVSAGTGATLALIGPFSESIFSFVKNTHFVLEEKKSTPASTQINSNRLTRPVNILLWSVKADSPSTSSPEKIAKIENLILLRFNPTDNSLHLLSIPKNTEVEIPKTGFTKLENVNAYFNGSADAVVELTSKTLNDITIDRYIRFKSDRLAELVNLLGGIEVFISEKDIAQADRKTVQPGWQTLNGERSLQFLDKQDDLNPNLAQIQRQQKIVQALQKRLHNPAISFRIPYIVRRFQQHLDTNLTPEEMLTLTYFMSDLERDHLKMVLLPGRKQANYWFVDRIERKLILNDYFAVPSTDTQPRRKNLQNQRIAIQNTTDRPDLARHLHSYLTQRNFENVYIAEDVPMELEKTEIIVQQGDLKAAHLLKKIISFARLELSSLGELDSDLTIRVGKDAKLFLEDSSFLKE